MPREPMPKCPLCSAPVRTDLAGNSKCSSCGFEGPTDFNPVQVIEGVLTCDEIERYDASFEQVQLDGEPLDETKVFGRPLWDWCLPRFYFEGAECRLQARIEITLVPDSKEAQDA